MLLGIYLDSNYTLDIVRLFLLKNKYIFVNPLKKMYVLYQFFNLDVSVQPFGRKGHKRQ